MYCNGIASYRKTDVVTSDPVGLVIKCYEGAIDSLKLAKQKIDEKDYEGQGKAIIKAQEIIEELLCSLDFEKGGEIANSLQSLYYYMLKGILRGSINKDIGAINEVVGMLDELLQAWREVYSQKGTHIQPAYEKLYEDRAPLAYGI